MQGLQQGRGADVRPSCGSKERVQPAVVLGDDRQAAGVGLRKQLSADFESLIWAPSPHYVISTFVIAGIAKLQIA